MSLLSKLFKRKPATRVERALDPVTGQPIPAPYDRQWAEGKVTYLGLILTAVGAVGKLFGWEVPVEEGQGMLDLILANWTELTQFVGLATAAYGRARLNWRKDSNPPPP